MPDVSGFPGWCSRERPLFHAMNEPDRASEIDGRGAADNPGLFKKGGADFIAVQSSWQLGTTTLPVSASSRFWSPVKVLSIKSTVKSGPGPRQGVRSRGFSASAANSMTTRPWRNRPTRPALDQPVDDEDRVRRPSSDFPSIKSRAFPMAEIVNLGYAWPRALQKDSSARALPPVMSDFKPVKKTTPGDLPGV